MMELGASRHWRDIMHIATGERKLSGRGILEYFAPLFTWLKERNAQLELEPGWDADEGELPKEGTFELQPNRCLLSTFAACSKE